MRTTITALNACWEEVALSAHCLRSSKPGTIPKHFVADEKHAKHLGKKAYIAMAAGGGCVLAAELTPSCNADS
ncbi:MAG: hypothetical protein ACI957_005301, partial [Verrucomicrobiales bacterium]